MLGVVADEFIQGILDNGIRKIVALFIVNSTFDSDVANLAIVSENSDSPSFSGYQGNRCGASFGVGAVVPRLGLHRILLLRNVIKTYKNESAKFPGYVSLFRTKNKSAPSLAF